MLVPRDFHAQTDDRSRGIVRSKRRRHEYLDSVVHHSADCMARRFHGVPRRWRFDSLAAGLRRYLVDTPLRTGKKSRVTRLSKKQLPTGSHLMFERGLDYPVKS